MDTDIIEIINRDFIIEQRKQVAQELSSIGLNHVMANSEYNLRNTRMSILKLANGNLNEIIELTEKAKIDFRDVISWASRKT